MVVVVVFARLMRVAGDAIARVGALDRDAQETLIADIGDPAAIGVELHRGVGDGRGLLAQVLLALGGHEPARLRRRGNVVVRAFAVQAVQAEHPAADARLDRSRHRRTLVDARARGQQAAMDALDLGARNAVVDDVDDAADRRPAIGQGRGPAQHLDPLGLLRVVGHLVVRRQRRGVDHPDAVAQHQHPRPGQAPDHRPARAGPEEGRAHAGQARQNIPEARGRRGVQVVALHDLDAGRHRVHRDDIGRGGHHQLGDLLGRLGMGRSRGQRSGAGGGEQVGLGHVDASANSRPRT